MLCTSYYPDLAVQGADVAVCTSGQAAKAPVGGISLPVTCLSTRCSLFYVRQERKSCSYSHVNGAGEFNQIGKPVPWENPEVNEIRSENCKSGIRTFVSCDQKTATSEVGN